MRQKMCLFVCTILMICNNSNLLAYSGSDTIPNKVITPIDSNQARTDSSSSKSQLRLTPAEFKYADNYRYTINGKTPLRETKIETVPALITGGIVATMFIGLHEYQANTIWKDKAVKFKIAEDMYQEIYLDKFGHFYGGYLDSYLAREALLASGFSDRAANIWGSVLGLSYQAYIEILDGYGEHWGFSPSDFYADVLGASFFLAQHYVPYLQNISPKFIYVPGSWTGDADRKGSQMFMDNYSSQVFFFSFNLGNMLPESWAEHYPKWLQPCVGYRVKNLNQDFARPHQMPEKFLGRSSNLPPKGIVRGDCKFLLSADVDLVKLLPDGPPFWNWLKQGLNLVKLPTPTIEFGEGMKPKFYLFYPFGIKFSF